MDKERLKEILESHGKWLKDEVGERADLREANLSEANLRRANLHRANLSRADLHRANLIGADLSRANLVGANLIGADLIEANLSEASLIGADLIEANLRGADLIGADLRGANLIGANLSEKIIQVGPIGSRKSYTIYWADRNIVQCGCWRDYEGGSLAEFKRRVDKIYPAENKDTLQYRNEYLAAIAMFERLRDDARQSL